MKNPRPNMLSVAYWKQRCLDYLYDFDTKTNRWEGVGCVCDPRIQVTYEHYFMHEAMLVSTFADTAHGLGYLKKAPGIECEVGAHDEGVMWQRFFRLLRIAYEHPDVYKIYCIRKGRHEKKLHHEYMTQDPRSNDWYWIKKDELEAELLNYAESIRE